MITPDELRAQTTKQSTLNRSPLDPNELREFKLIPLRGRVLCISRFKRIR